MSRRQRRRRSAARPQGAHKRLATGAGISLAAALGAPAAAQATDFTVTTLADPVPDACDVGDCSLREAVEGAGGSATDDRVLFQAGLTGTIALGGGKGHLYVDEPLEVLGPGAAALTVSADAASRIFRINTAVDDPVTISGLTLSGGDVSFGGAIQSSNAELTVRDSTISGNDATIRGGGVYSFNGTMTIEDSTISGNNSTDRGGGVLSRQGTTTIESSTISGNDASFFAGGVYSRNGTTTIEGSTISGNEAGSVGGGVRSESSPTDPILANTIVAANAAPTAPDLRGAGGDEFDAAFSLIGSPAGATVNETVAGSNITGQSAQLGPLAENGGPTATMAPSYTSPAVDQGAALGPTDQRGLTRPFDLPGIPSSSAPGANGADIGAVELQLPSNAFTLGALARNRKKGTATLAVTVPGAGRLVLGGAKVKGQTKNPAGAGVVKLLIRAKGRAAKRLRGTGKAKVLAKLTFTPTAGNPSTKSRKVRLIERKPR